MSQHMGNITLTLEDINQGMAGKRYQHYKGTLYTVLCVGTQEATGVVEVVYQSMHDHKIWIRPIDEFLDSVQVDNRQEQRFSLIRD